MTSPSLGQSTSKQSSNHKGAAVKIKRVVFSFIAVLLCAMLILADSSRPPNNQISARIGIWTIRIYQQKLHRFAHPLVRCRLQPTCSRFALLALREQGVAGIFKIGGRLWMCSRTAPIQNSGSHAAYTQAERFGRPEPSTLAVFQSNPPSPDAGCAACLAGTTGFVLFLLAWFGAGIALLVWVVRDAKSRSVESPILWMLLVLVLSWLGLIIYLLSRPGGNLVACEHCNSKKLQYARLCPHCGNVDSRGPTAPTREVREVYLERGFSSSAVSESLQPAKTKAALPKLDEPATPTASLGPEKGTQRFCDQCGTKLDPGAQFCEECGAKL